MAQPDILEVEYAGRTFRFELFLRDLYLGGPRYSKYLWMDSRRFRQGHGGPNYRACVDFWWHAVEQAGAADDLDNLTTLVLAEAYPLVNTAKAVQNVFVDAHLHPTADRTYEIEEEDGIRRWRSIRDRRVSQVELDRLHEVAQSRDTHRIRAEIDTLFRRDPIPANELPAHQEAARGWIGNGIVAMRLDDREGLQQYLGTLDEWIRKLRRCQGNSRVRSFLNHFAYECKVSFYLCYCSDWVGILQTLGDHVTPVEQRFMQLWHGQARTVSNNRDDDLLFGQVLALHPLSNVTLTTPDYLHIIGRWIGHADYESMGAEGRLTDCPEYWDVVATVLWSAHEYHASRTRWELARNLRTDTNAPVVEGAASQGDDLPVSRVLEELATRRNVVCQRCSSVLRYDRHSSDSDGGDTVIVYYRCSSCDQEVRLDVGYDELRDLLSGG